VRWVLLVCPLCLCVSVVKKCVKKTNHRDTETRSSRPGVLLTEDHRDVVVLAIRNHDIGLAVAVKIAQSDTGWSMADVNVVAGFKATFAVATKNRHVVALGVTDCDVGVTVAINIANGYARRPAARAKWRTSNGAERSSAIAEQHCYAVVLQVVGAARIIGDDEICIAVLINIAHGNSE